MKEKKSERRFDDLFQKLGIKAALCVEAIQKDYALSIDEAKMLYHGRKLFEYGKSCVYKIKELEEK